MPVDAGSSSRVPWLPARDEAQRQAVVDDVHVDPLLRTALEDLAWQAAHAFGSPMAAVTVLDRDRQLLEARYGIDVFETPRELALCNWTIAAPLEVTVFEDTASDPRLIGNSLVHGEMGLGFYAGAALTLRSGHSLGALCVLDTKPRQPDDAQLAKLRSLADLAVAAIEARRFRR